MAESHQYGTWQVSLLQSSVHTKYNIELFVPPGTTWLQEITYLVCNDTDTSKANQGFLYDRFPYLEASLSRTGPDGLNVPQLDYVLSMTSPRLIKTHLPLRFFERTLKQSSAKVLVPIRNPKDLLVSHFHFLKLFPEPATFHGTWDEYFQNLFVKKQLGYEDYFDFYEAWWRYKTENPSQVLFVWYEDLQRDLPRAIHTVANFLGKPMTEEQVQRIKEHTGFESMKKNESICPAPFAPREMFFRKGEVGDWKNYFSQAQSEYVDTLVRERLTPLGLEIMYH